MSQHLPDRPEIVPRIEPMISVSVAQCVVGGMRGDPAVCHFPPGMSKWNKIEHRLFSFISQNWRGKPLVSHETIVNLIAATTTEAGLKVTCEPDQGIYPSGIKVSKKEREEINLRRDAFHGEWNDTISPRSQKWVSIP